MKELIKLAKGWRADAYSGRLSSDRSALLDSCADALEAAIELTEKPSKFVQVSVSTNYSFQYGDYTEYAAVDELGRVWQASVDSSGKISEWRMLPLPSDGGEE